MSVKTFAAIDLGSYELAMKIYEFSGKNKMREIDHVCKQVDLGSGTYATGKIEVDKMDELCRTLKEFIKIMESYQVAEYKAYATSAIRETRNSTIVLDQIRQQTGLNVQILSNSEQRFLDHKAIASRTEFVQRIIPDRNLIVDIGGGSIQLSLFDGGRLVSTQNLILGVLRIQEVMHHIHANSSNFEQLVDEMISSQLDSYKRLYLKDREIQNIIVVDDYISPWAVQKCGKNAMKGIGVPDFQELMKLLRMKDRIFIAEKLGVAEEKVSLVYISAILTTKIMAIAGAETVWAPGVTLCDGIAYEYGEKLKLFKGEHNFEEDIVTCALNVSKRYMGSKKRAETLEAITTTIFNSMKKVHGLGKRELLYLRLAAILQDCGKYISLVDIGETSYDIILATEIIGISHIEREIVASIVRFNHSPFIYYEQSNKSLDRQTYLIVSKLTAILRLATSMDRSHKQKLKGVTALLKEHELYISVDTMEDITLETGYFREEKMFFQEVFSVTPILKQKKKF